MDANALLSSDYIKAADLGGRFPAEPTWKIVRIDLEEMESIKKAGKMVSKGIVYMDGAREGWVMNRTNVECLKAMFGGDTDAWIGKRITLCAETVQVGPKKDRGIRVKGSPDITEPVTARWQPPRKAPISRTMVPTGRQNGSQRQLPPDTNADPFPKFADACRSKYGINADDVCAYMAAGNGPDPRTLTADNLRALFADMAPGTERRQDFDRWMEPAGEAMDGGGAS